MISGVLNLGENSVRGHIIVRSAPGAVVATLPVHYASVSDAEAISDAVRRVRREVAIVFARDEESAQLARAD